MGTTDPKSNPEEPSKGEGQGTESPLNLPDKPSIENMPPEEGVPAPDDAEVAQEPEPEFLNDEDADEDDTVDNQEDPDADE